MDSPDPIAEFDRRFREQLERHTGALVEELRLITSTPPLPGAGAIGFCQEADWEGFPVFTFVLDSTLRKELLDERPYESLLLQSAGPLVEDGAIDQEAFEDAGIGTYGRGAELLSRWFADCWDRAGGAAFPLPAFIYLHDDTSYYDLRAKRYVEELEELSKPAATSPAAGADRR
jgi:hypothetical protein